MIDIGANLTHDSFNHDRNQVITEAYSAGVKTLIITGSNADCSKQACQLAYDHDHCFSTAGIHPHHAAEFNQDTLDEIEQLLRNEKVVAVGETGLDYFRDFSPRPAQQFSFEQHIQLAIKHELPMFLHQREAHTDFLPMLKEYRDHLNKLVVHCFTDQREALFSYLDLDCYIGITGWVCDERRGYHLHELVPQIPLNRLMIETDSPYLLPRNLDPKPQSRRNEPKYLPHIAQFIADLYRISFTKLVNATTENSRLFFNL